MLVLFYDSPFSTVENDAFTWAILNENSLVSRYLLIKKNEFEQKLNQ